MYEELYSQPTGQSQQSSPFGQPVTPPPAPEPEKPAMAKKQRSGVFGKLMTGLFTGLLFGLFAGLGFYAVARTTGTLDLIEAGRQQAQVQVQESLPQQQESSADVYTPDTIVNTPAQAETEVVTSLISSDAEARKYVIDKVMPSMVSIVEYYTDTENSFWGYNYSYDASASGSGIIIGETDTEYIIVTNNHVIEAAEELEVTFADDSIAEANVKGTDASKDIAIIAVQKAAVNAQTRAQIAIATLGDSDELEIGEDVIAIGNALGYGQSVTNGIISAMNREVTTEDGYTNLFIQTNAAINPGNSGGALLNLNGEVIGINSNKIGGTAVEGMGYAIPISSVKDIIEELMMQDTLIRVAEDEVGYIGISLQEINSSMATKFGMPQGIYIVETVDGGAADLAGLQSGDVITGFGGRKIGSYSELQNILQYYAAGTTVSISYERQEGGTYTEYTVDLTLGKQPTEP